MSIALLAVGDGGVNTGFERVVRGVLTHLHETGKYEITHRAIGYHEPKLAQRTYPWETVSWGGSSADPFAVTDFARWERQHRPDAVLLVQDLWNITNYLAYKSRELPAIGYFPVDTPNMKWSYAMGTGALSEAATYTQFAARETGAGVRETIDLVYNAQTDDSAIKQGAQATWLTLPKEEMQLHCRMDRLARRQNADAFSVIPHALDRGLFQPRDKQTCRKLFDLPADAFIVQYVSTNQFRKRQDIAIRGFAEFARNRPDANALLVLHCQGGDKGGWDLMQLAAYYGVADKVACTHYAKKELTEDELVTLYNCADLHINTSGGEGWGLTSFESAACGVPQLVPDWSATRELWKDHGVLLKVADWRHEPKYLNTAHATLDVRALAKTLDYLYRQPEYREVLSRYALEQVARQPTWSEVGAAFDALIERALNEPDPTPMSFQAAIELRDATTTSELAGRPI